MAELHPAVTRTRGGSARALAAAIGPSPTAEEGWSPVPLDLEEARAMLQAIAVALRRARGGAAAR